MRQISHTEFWIIYVDIPPSKRGSMTHYFLVVGYTVTSFQSIYIMERGGENNFTVEKSEKPHLSQVIKVNINRDKSCW